MKKLLLLVVVLGLLVGCAGFSTIEKVQNALGPPARTEQLGNGNITLYYYKACNDIDCLCNEFTYDRTGNLITQKRYWTQPNTIDPRYLRKYN
jgi:hypothetical protein